MLRIAKSLLTILAVAVVAVGATGAYFSDTEVVASNTFATGTLDLKLLPGWLSSSAPLTGSALKPGDNLSNFVVMQNAGTVGVSRVGLTSTKTNGSQYLYDELRVKVWGVNWPTGWPNFARTSELVDMRLADLSDYQIWTTLGPTGTSTGVRAVDVYLPTTADNSYQGLSATWQFDFVATQ